MSSAWRQGHFQIQAGDFFDPSVTVHEHVEDELFVFARQVGVLNELVDAAILTVPLPILPEIALP
jgi:hypothetical protein